MTIFIDAEKMEKKVNKLNDENTKILIRIDLNMFNCMVGYLLNMESPLITFKNIQQMHKLFNKIDPKPFYINENLKIRYNFIMGVLHEIVDVRHHLILKDDLLVFINERFNHEDYKDILDNLDKYNNMSSYQIEFTRDSINDRLNYIYLDAYKDEIRDELDKLDSNEFNSYREINENLRIIMAGLFSKIRSSNLNETNIRTLSTLDENMDNVVLDLIKKFRDDSRVLKTGMKRLNEMLSPGFVGSNLYLFAGIPNTGKTLILTKSMLGIQKYNSNVKLKRLDRKPVVLFITAEDTMEKMLGRIFSDLVPNVDLKKSDYSNKELAEMLKQHGFGDSEAEINIVVKYYNEKEIDTNDIYGIIDEVEDENNEVIALIVDYVKRIRPALYAKEEKDELKNVTNELRNIAVNYDIPVISACQMNREAAKAVDNAIMDNKNDVAKKIGRSNIGSSWAMLENTDALINIYTELYEDPTTKKNTKWMSFMRMKLRYEDLFNVTYFVQPYSADGKRLLDDINLPEGSYVSKLELSHEVARQKDIKYTMQPEMKVTSMDTPLFMGKAINSKG